MVENLLDNLYFENSCFKFILGFKFQILSLWLTAEAHELDWSAVRN